MRKSQGLNVLSDLDSLKSSSYDVMATGEKIDEIA